jgi:predicted transcriptional regulator
VSIVFPDFLMQSRHESFLSPSLRDFSGLDCFPRHSLPILCHGAVGNLGGGGGRGGLNWQVLCITLYDMRHAVTIRLDDDLERMLEKFCRRSGRKRSDVIRDALRRQLSLLIFEQLRQKVMPFAEARGYLTDEDIFKSVS